MSNTGKFYDAAPYLVPAGKITTLADENTRACIEPEIYAAKAPPTPPEIKKYRRSFNATPGKRCIHVGKVEDVIDESEKAGVKTHKDESAEEVLAQGPKSTLQFWENERAEKIYQSSSREPLGTGFVRGHNLPPETKDPEYRFGCKSDFSVSAKELLFPADAEDDDEGYAHEMYKKSHHDYDPGEQKRRDYKWNKVDPTHHRFGYQDKDRMFNGVAAAMAADPSGPKTVIAVKRLEDYKHTRTDGLGQVKKLPSKDYTLPPDHVFGVPSSGLEEWGAKECLTGHMKGDDVEPEENLGRCTIEGSRNFTDSDRKFGVPSIRTDIPPPGIRSVTDNQNYGGEPDAKQLLYPPKFAYSGVMDEDFLQAVPKEELRSLVQATKMVTEDSEFEAIYAAVAAEVGEGNVSVDAFKNKYFERKKERTLRGL